MQNAIQNMPYRLQNRWHKRTSTTGSDVQSSLQSREDFDLLKLSGEIDLEYSPKVREQILASLKAGNALLIDLADVKYIDNSGIASL